MLMRAGGKILGIGDLICVLVIWLGDWFPQRWLWYVAIYLIIKGLIFIILGGIGSLFSWLDFFHGAYYALFLSTGIHSEWISFAFMLYLTAKGLWSLV
ncbi:MAG: hypothetical protein ACMXYE_02325 [Candidatus Woesearchaeota archaeon]